jgi:hypothetical protein
MFFECNRALVKHHASGIEALADNFDWDPGFWLHDGGATHKCRSRGQVGCIVRQHSRRIGNGVEMVQYHLELSDIFILAIDQFNDLRPPTSSECSTR